MKKVVINIIGGKVTADFSGFQGRACEHLHDKIRPENLEVDEAEQKPEYYQEASLSEHETNQF